MSKRRGKFAWLRRYPAMASSARFISPRLPAKSEPHRRLFGGYAGGGRVARFPARPGNRRMVKRANAIVTK
jgi:hypothetical protein